MNLFSHRMRKDENTIILTSQMLNQFNPKHVASKVGFNVNMTIAVNLDLFLSTCYEEEINQLWRKSQ